MNSDLVSQICTTMETCLRGEVEAAIAAMRSAIDRTFDRNTFSADLASVMTARSRAYPFYGFNGQFIRASLFLHLLRALPIDTFVETGTFQGHTSLLVAAQTNLQILTCELFSSNFQVAKSILEPFKDRVQVSMEDSRVFLNRILRSKVLSCPFFYLDAHWYADLPLLGEIAQIVGNVADFIIAIDDFRVPADDSFGFDCYPNARLEWDYISPTISVGPKISKWYPSYPSSLESGAKRGFILLVSESLTPFLKGNIPGALMTESD